MFLSRLIPLPRHPLVRKDLANAYDLHRTLLRAFPDREVGGAGRVLYRVEERDGAGPCVLVQSEKSPSWNNLPVGYLEHAETKSLSGLRFDQGQALRFRLRANPTRRVGKKETDPQWIGKRVGLMREPDQVDWLARKGASGGFHLGDGRNGDPLRLQVISEGLVTARKNGQSLSFLAVRFEGVLIVTEPDRFLDGLRQGIGSGKGLGFGLMSVARTEGAP